MSLLRSASFQAAALAHFAVDLLNSQRPVLLAVLSVPLGLTNAMIGLISMLYTFSASLSQPVFGWLADRAGTRAVGAGGVIWMGGLFALAMITPGSGSLVLLILAALGSAAFHPAGTVEAAESGRVHFSGQDTTAASIFFLFGQAGYSIGPAIGGPLIDRWGPPGLLVLVPFMLPIGLFTSRRFTPSHPAKPWEAAPGARASAGWGVFLPLAVQAALRSWAQTNVITFLPKYYSDLGYSPSTYGVLAALFMAGSAVGGVGGGWLADRVDKRHVMLWTMVLGAVPLALFPTLATTAWAYALAPLAGALTGASHSISVVLAQRALPGRLGAASGLGLGFTFASGSVGTLLSGVQADLAGFDVVFWTTAAISLGGGLAALFVRDVPKLPGRTALPAVQDSAGD